MEKSRHTPVSRVRVVEERASKEEKGRWRSLEQAHL